ncbi:MAG: hypothetical protein WBD40_23955 [Tepidisphaeraceae bacterium]
MDERNDNFIGIGIYGVPDAARLTQVPARRIHRWVKGYAYKTEAGEWKPSAPIWQRQLPIIDGKVALGFRDLIEVRVVNAMLNHDISWPTIKRVHQHAQDLFKVDHPFATSLFRTDGRTVFIDLKDGRGGQSLLDLAESQYAFRNLINPYLEHIEFNSKKQAMRWWPMGESRSIVVDPGRNFGQPIVSDAGVPTAVLAAAVKVEGSAESVAKWYAVKLRSVRAAVEFENQLSEKQLVA